MNKRQTLHELATLPVGPNDLDSTVDAMVAGARKARRLRALSAMGMSLVGCGAVLMGASLALRPTLAFAFSDSLEVSRGQHNTVRTHYVVLKDGTRQPYMAERSSPPLYRMDTYSDPFAKDNHLWSILIYVPEKKTLALVIDENGKPVDNPNGWINATEASKRFDTDDFAVMQKTIKASKVEGPDRVTWGQKDMFKYQVKSATMTFTAYVEPESRLIRFMDVRFIPAKHLQRSGRDFNHQQIEFDYPKAFPEETFDRDKLRAKFSR